MAKPKMRTTGDMLHLIHTQLDKSRASSKDVKVDRAALTAVLMDLGTFHGILNGKFEDTE